MVEIDFFFFFKIKKWTSRWSCAETCTVVSVVISLSYRSFVFVFDPQSPDHSQASTKFLLFDSNSAKLERHHPSSSALSWPSDDRRPNFNHQFDPYVQYPNHHPGPPFGHPNYPPQYPPHPPPPPPPPPPQHQPPFQHQHPHTPQPQPQPPPPHQHQQPYQHQQNNWSNPEFHNHPPDYRPQPHFNGETSEGFGNGGLRSNCGNQNANLGRKRPRNYSNRTVPPGTCCLMNHVA